MQNRPRKVRRTANACFPCRQSKIKCSGEQPCSNCKRRLMRCRFEESTSRLSTIERDLQDVHKNTRASRFLYGSSTSSQKSGTVGLRSATCADTVASAAHNSHQHTANLGLLNAQTDELPPMQGLDDDAHSIWTSPFSHPSTTIKYSYKNKRNWIWLAPSSTWSFTTRLTLLMIDKLKLETLDDPAKILLEDIYPLRWNPPQTDEIPEIAGLPSIDHALYLFNTVKFHLGQNYRFWDEESFLSHLRDFYYRDAASKAGESRIWFVQFLLILAFGSAFLARGRTSAEPPGSHYFLRAMALMPDITSLWRDSLLGIEVLVLAGLYLYSIDQREAAHVYVGQAMRIAQMEGLHTSLPENELGVDTVHRCRNLWWTIYIMDRHISCSLGVPMSTQDGDITTPLSSPGITSQEDSTLSLQVRLSRLLSYIITTIYRTERTQLATFLDNTRSILQSLAGHAQEIEQIIHLTFQSSVDAISRETRHITLLYHQCVIVATRPLLLSVLKERLEKLGQEEEDWREFLLLTKSLISTGIKSAVKTIQILSTDDGLLEVFLPFDLEFTYGAAIHIVMANALFPPTEDNPTYIQETYAILDEMIAKGNRVAKRRKDELVHLQTLFNELSKRAERSGLLTLTLSTPEMPEFGPQNNPILERQQDVSLSNTPQPMIGRLGNIPSTFQPEVFNNEFLDNIGISSCEFLSIIEQMGTQDDSYTILDPIQ